MISCVCLGVGGWIHYTCDDLSTTYSHAMKLAEKEFESLAWCPCLRLPEVRYSTVQPDCAWTGM